MLDYILSRLVILAFLLLIVGLLVSYQNFLGTFFLAGSAKNMAVDVAEKIRGTISNLSVANESRKIRLPPFIQSGPVRSPYKLILGCKEDGDKKVLGIGIEGPRGNLLYAKKIEIYIPGLSVELNYAREFNGGEVMLIKKEVSPSSVSITIGNCHDDVTCGVVETSGGCG